MASHSVFDIVEILEQILLRLPWTDILRCQRVSRFFSNVIDGSTDIKQKLFLTPGPIQNDCEEVIYSSRKPRRDLMSGPRRSLCPSFFQVMSGVSKPQQAKMKTNVAKDVLYTISLPAPILRTGSWKDMYLTNPPVVEVGYWFRIQVRPGASWRCSGKARDERGLTLGRLLELAMAQKPKSATFTSAKGVQRYRREHFDSPEYHGSVKSEVEEYTRAFGGELIVLSKGYGRIEFELDGGKDLACC